MPSDSLKYSPRTFFVEELTFPSVFVAKRSTEAMLSSVAFDILYMLIPQHQQWPLPHLKQLLLVLKLRLIFLKPRTVTLVGAVATPIAIAKEPIPETTIPIAPIITPITVATAVSARTIPPVIAMAFCTGPGNELNPSTSFCKPATKH